LGLVGVQIAEFPFIGGFMKISININNKERALRIFGGLFIASLAFWGPRNYWYLLGLIPTFTGLVGWCPPYALLGINTNKRSEK
jgi:hypothetical protein